MSIILPSVKESENLLRRYITDSRILKHCQATQQKALVITNLISPKITVDLNLVEISALLHDIGRAYCHDITHGYVGGQLLKQYRFPVKVIKIVERHVLGGFTAKEAYQVGLPKRSFVPRSWEEKIVCVADKLGLYMWNEIGQPQKWLSKMDARFSKLRERYEFIEPYRISIQRARKFAQILATIALTTFKG